MIVFDLDAAQDLKVEYAEAQKRVQELLPQAREELEELEARCATLSDWIERAEAMVADEPLGLLGRIKGVGLPRRNRDTLHEALIRVLEGNKGEPMLARDLADEVNSRGLFHKRDGSRVEANEVHARVGKYPALFEKVDSKIGLKEGATDALPAEGENANVAIFRDDDKGFFRWLADNPDGFIVNTPRKPDPTNLVLHKSGCPHFDGDEAVRWTKTQAKICSPDRDDLERWALDAVGAEPALCRTCFG